MSYRWVLLFALASGLLLPGCRGAQSPPHSVPGPASSGNSTFTTPPFSTKEPDRYRAIRVTSFTTTPGSEDPSPAQTNQVLIARDGQSRREEYAGGAMGQIVYLEIPTGHFILLPTLKQYADLDTLSSAPTSPDRPDRPERPADDPPLLSPDQLLNESHPSATYEKLGNESLSGRTTTKYRVVVLNGATTSNETFIWVDDQFGMPVKSETITTSNGQSTKVTTELRDVSFELDESLFSWPSGYKKVEAEHIFELMRKEGKASPPAK
jgi:outer membrane lipoprotein-sorting protein